MHKTAGFLYGLDLHHLDHLAPLCSLLSIPLIFTNDITLAVAEEFYPNVTTIPYPALTFSESILLKYDILFSCLPKELIDPLFFFDEHKLRKKILSIWLPHGNSDKDNLEGLKSEKIILAYGKQMVDILARKGVLAKLFQYILLGNYRAQFFEKNRSYYESLLKKKLSFSNKNKTLLYAPTWNNSRIEQDLPYILKNLPQNFNLFVKLHPNTLTKSFHFSLKEQYDDKPNIKFVDEIPTIYPILEKIDILITDLSSIAYDFLYFDRPIFYLTDTKLPIHNTGYISCLESLFADLKKPDIFRDARKTLYQYAFTENVNYEMLPTIIKTTYEIYFENELHFL